MIQDGLRNLKLESKLTNCLIKNMWRLKMSNIKHIFIHMQNLTDDQQLKLWHNLWKFADKELPAETNLMCFVVTKNKPEVAISSSHRKNKKEATAFLPHLKSVGIPPKIL